MRTNKILLPVVGLTVITGVAWRASREPAALAPTKSIATLVAPPPAAPPGRTRGQGAVFEPVPAGSEEVNPSAPAVPAVPASASETISAEDDAFEQSVNLLVSPQATFRQKQAVWGQLRSTGQIGRVMAALQQMQAADPTSAEIPVQLGMAYLINISTTTDVRQQGIGGMLADLSFDAALKLDPTNWEAGFLKASALSHWPDSMKMGPQLIQRFTTLIEQQEIQPARPEFVQSYVLLGDQYQKSGQPDAARQVWSRGLIVFPGSPTLAQRLNPGP